MPRPRSLLCVLTPLEIQEFLPGPMLDELRAQADAFHLLDPSALDAEGLARELAARNPEVLVACWKCPTLPAALPPALRYVCYLSGSVKRLLTRAHLERGLLVTNWGNSISRVVAECGLLLALAALRRANHWALAMHRGGAWKVRETRFESLFQRRVGLHGFGAIAQEMVRLLRPFDVTIATFSPSVPDTLLAQHGVTRAASLEDLFSQNDVIIELAALTPANRHLVGARLLRLIPEGGVFVNIGRGAVTDEAAIARLAQEGRLHFGIDVFETEPLPLDHPFRGQPNIALLPHLGGPTTDRRRDAGALALANLRAYGAGLPLDSVITPTVYDRST
ncbi:MAG: hydroxyacid dehydrogenase [Opitutae bacterium]|nr:hydroxyacid dehydrogenase [Opitutae bacterium]